MNNNRDIAWQRTIRNYYIIVLSYYRYFIKTFRTEYRTIICNIFSAMFNGCDWNGMKLCFENNLTAPSTSQSKSILSILPIFSVVNHVFIKSHVSPLKLIWIKIPDIEHYYLYDGKKRTGFHIGKLGHLTIWDEKAKNIGKLLNVSSFFRLYH